MDNCQDLFFSENPKRLKTQNLLGLETQDLLGLFYDANKFDSRLSSSEDNKHVSLASKKAMIMKIFPFLSDLAAVGVGHSFQTSSRRIQGEDGREKDFWSGGGLWLRQ